MQVVLVVSAWPDVSHDVLLNHIAALDECLDHDTDALTVICRATDTELSIALQQRLADMLFTEGRDASHSDVLGRGVLRLWQPSSIDAPEVQACLLASFIAQFNADVVVWAGNEHLEAFERVRDICKFTAPIIELSALLAGLAASGDGANAKRRDVLEGLTQPSSPPTTQKLKLAVLSPMPPARSGVADCTADLLVGLRDYYDITVIDTTPPEFQNWQDSDPEREGIQTLPWFLAHAHEFDRVVYQLGNSDYHAGMWPAMTQVPGVAAVHDLYMGDYLSSEQGRGYPRMWPEILMYEHGYKALARAHSNHHDAVIDYPGNYRAFRDSLGVVLHSDFARQLASEQVGSDINFKTRVIPLVRQPMSRDGDASPLDPAVKASARAALGLPENALIVCSFGYISASKLPDRILEAWRQSELSQNPDAMLIFVGRNHPGKFGEEVLQTIASLAHPERVLITGFVSGEDFARYLSAADFAVQLRDFSRGETSGAVMHAMGHGLPQIVNANGSFAELDPDAALVLPDKFETTELVHAMQRLANDPVKRHTMAIRGIDVIEQKHSPRVCAEQYRDFIETCYQKRLASHPRQTLTAIRQAWPDGDMSPHQRASLAAAIELNRAAALPRPRLLLDMTTTLNTGMQTGIQRVALALFDALVDMEPAGLVVTPVYLSDRDGAWKYYQANEFMAKHKDLQEHWLYDHEVIAHAQDILLTLDLSTDALKQANEQGLYENYRAHGVRCYGIVYDLLPISMPDKFPPKSKQAHTQWLTVISQFDGALCISDHVASELATWRAEHDYSAADYRIGSFMLGADTETFKQEKGKGASPTPINTSKSASPAESTGVHKPYVFLMVGTIEPRKGYLETIRAFFELWHSGFDARLIIVGREGWRHLKDEDRSDIPETVRILSTHPERFRRLLWMNNADDAALERAYARADCLIAASYDEGFGLPIIEATRHGVPVLARDIAVFREVAPAGTQFFKDGELADTIRHWTKPAQPPEDIHTITWRQSAQQVLRWLAYNPQIDE